MLEVILLIILHCTLIILLSVNVVLNCLCHRKPPTDDYYSGYTKQWTFLSHYLLKVRIINLIILHNIGVIIFRVVALDLLCIYVICIFLSKESSSDFFVFHLNLFLTTEIPLATYPLIFCGLHATCGKQPIFKIL